MQLKCVTAILLPFLVSAIFVLGQQENAVNPLSEAHSFIERPDGCGNCHEEPEKVSPQRCLKCHKSISDQMAGQGGMHGAIQVDCDICHTIHSGDNAGVNSLETQSFDHAASTGFALTGAHANVACAQCHQSADNSTPNPECSSCHQDAHRGGLGAQCNNCHTPTSFQITSRAFHKQGSFPLEGSHLALPCDSCHTKGEIQGTPNRCYDCHWIRRQDDPYRTQLGNECEECHNATSWIAVQWDHASTSGVVLNAEHRALACDSCHSGKIFQGSPVICISCHQRDYQRAQNPNHAAAGYSTTCDECHSASASDWLGATFNHNSYFQLLGVHATQDCSACHANNLYQGTPRDCFPCHQSDYQNARDPNHISAGYSTTCEGCHKASDNAWDQGFFAHPYFPITSGRHANYDCSDCHTDPNNYKVFSCTRCHDRGDTNEEHQGVSGYLYDSQACFECHPQGTE